MCTVHWPLEDRHWRPGYIAGTKRNQKAEVCGGKGYDGHEEKHSLGLRDRPLRQQARAAARLRRSPGDRTSPRTLSRKKQALVSWISETPQEHKEINRTESLNSCIAHFGSAITREWIDSFLFRHRDGLFETESVPQAGSRLLIPSDRQS
jgi:hypothetical protein